MFQYIQTFDKSSKIFVYSGMAKILRYHNYSYIRFCNRLIAPYTRIFCNGLDIENLKLYPSLLGVYMTVHNNETNFLLS